MDISNIKTTIPHYIDSYTGQVLDILFKPPSSNDSTADDETDTDEHTATMGGAKKPTDEELNASIPDRPLKERVHADISDEFKDQIPDIPSPSQSKEKFLNYANDRLHQIETSDSKAKELRKKAQSDSISIQERDELNELAEKEERRSAQEMRAVNRLQSGVWQGAGMGGGIGAGLGMGVGAAVGTIVGSVVSLPTTGLGILAGAATGAVHGSWFKIPGAEGMKKDRADVKVDDN